MSWFSCPQFLRKKQSSDPTTRKASTVSIEATVRTAETNRTAGRLGQDKPNRLLKLSGPSRALSTSIWTPSHRNDEHRHDSVHALASGSEVSDTRIGCQVTAVTSKFKEMGQETWELRQAPTEIEIRPKGKSFKTKTVLLNQDPDLMTATADLARRLTLRKSKWKPSSSDQTMESITATTSFNRESNRNIFRPKFSSLIQDTSEPNTALTVPRRLMRDMAVGISRVKSSSQNSEPSKLTPATTELSINPTRRKLTKSPPPPSRLFATDQRLEYERQQRLRAYQSYERLRHDLGGGEWREPRILAQSTHTQERWNYDSLAYGGLDAAVQRLANVDNEHIQARRGHRRLRTKSVPAISKEWWKSHRSQSQNSDTEYALDTPLDIASPPPVPAQTHRTRTTASFPTCTAFLATCASSEEYTKISRPQVNMKTSLDNHSIASHRTSWPLPSTGLLNEDCAPQEPPPIPPKSPNRRLGRVRITDDGVENDIFCHAEGATTPNFESRHLEVQNPKTTDADRCQKARQSKVSAITNSPPSTKDSKEELELVEAIKNSILDAGLSEVQPTIGLDVRQCHKVLPNVFSGGSVSHLSTKELIATHFNKSQPLSSQHQISVVTCNCCNYEICIHEPRPLFRGSKASSVKNEPQVPSLCDFTLQSSSSSTNTQPLSPLTSLSTPLFDNETSMYGDEDTSASFLDRARTEKSADSGCRPLSEPLLPNINGGFVKVCKGDALSIHPFRRPLLSPLYTIRESTSPPFEAPGPCCPIYRRERWSLPFEEPESSTAIIPRQNNGFATSTPRATSDPGISLPYMIASTPTSTSSPRSRCADCKISVPLFAFPVEPPSKTCAHQPITCMECLAIWIQSEIEMMKENREIKCPNCKELLEFEDVKIWATRNDLEAYAKRSSFFEGENEADGGVEVPRRWRRIWSQDL
jgi:hypothetical protein